MFPAYGSWKRKPVECNSLAYCFYDVSGGKIAMLQWPTCGRQKAECCNVLETALELGKVKI